jgi:hypothetical protein
MPFQTTKIWAGTLSSSESAVALMEWNSVHTVGGSGLVVVIEIVEQSRKAREGQRGQLHGSLLRMLFWVTFEPGPLLGGNFPETHSGESCRGTTYSFQK